VSFGISLKNSSGQEMLVGVEKSMALVGKGYSDFTSRFDYKLTGYSGLSPPMVYVNFPNNNNTCSVKTQRNSSGEWEIVLFKEFNGSTTVTAYWYIFAEIPNQLIDNYGIVIYNQNNQVAYHSGYLPLQNVHGALVSDSGDSINISSNLPSKMAHIVFPAKLSSFSGSQQSGGYRVVVSMIKRTPSTLLLSGYLYSGKFASPGVVFATQGYWESMFATTIDASLYD